jgi:hypothetical protein
MDQIEHERAVRAVHREVVLALIGVFGLYEVAPDVETATARALTAIALGRACGVARPRSMRGRAAMRALLNEIERPDMTFKQSMTTTNEE